MYAKERPGWVGPGCQGLSSKCGAFLVAAFESRPSWCDQESRAGTSLVLVSHGCLGSDGTQGLVLVVEAVWDRQGHVLLLTASMSRNGRHG